MLVKSSGEPTYLLPCREIGVILSNSGRYHEALPYLERARGLGGWAEVSSSPGRGTTVMFSIPPMLANGDGTPAGPATEGGDDG